MTTPNIENINVTAFDTMPTPEEIHAKLPISDKAAKTVTHGATCCARFSIARITACLSSSAVLHPRPGRRPRLRPPPEEAGR
jgi:hypothetical protein